MLRVQREIIFLLLQFLEDKKYRESLHKLEMESGVYFNMKHFEDAVMAGDWEEVEKYLSGFTKIEDNHHSRKIFFEIHKQKYLEALNRSDKAKAVEILRKDLKVFKSTNEELFLEITMLLTLDNIRENELLSKYTDTKTSRTVLVTELKKLIKANPAINDKLRFPVMRNSRLCELIIQSFNWQRRCCPSRQVNLDTISLLEDHSCISSNGVCMSSATKAVLNTASQPPAPLPTYPAGWMPNPSLLSHSAVPYGHWGLTTGMHHPVAPKLRSPLNTVAGPLVDYHKGNQENALTRRSVAVPEEVVMPTTQISQSPTSPDDLPKTLAGILNQSIPVTSMDFHPTHPYLLLVGTNMGHIEIWQVATRAKLAFRYFRIWNFAACSPVFQNALIDYMIASVNRIIWNHDGSQFGVAYSKHIVHIYKFDGRADIWEHLEIDAHVGGVNDLVFTRSNREDRFITCGDDKAIKVWHAGTGEHIYTLIAHAAPVYSICMHSKETILFSASVDGRVERRIHVSDPKVNFPAPGLCPARMISAADGTRLFSCGTSTDGRTFLVEWNAADGTFKQHYTGLRKSVTGAVHFDTSGRVIAAGNHSRIKFWDMDNEIPIAHTNAGGRLPASPLIRFNNDGSLLAATTNDGFIKILAKTSAIQPLQAPPVNGTQAMAQAVPMESMASNPPSTTAVADQGAPVTATEALAIAVPMESMTSEAPGTTVVADQGAPVTATAALAVPMESMTSEAPGTDVAADQGAPETATDTMNEDQNS